MFLTEWKYVLHTHGMLKIILGILLVPTFYAVIFLASLWDPYGNIKNLPIGIVNEDTAVTRQHTRYQLGKQLTHELVTNHQADFHQLSAHTAAKRLKNGQLYMAITIPHNFSKRATVLGTTATQAIYLNYHTNAGFSFIAMKMNTTTAEKVQAKINQQLTTSYLTVMAHTLQHTGNQLVATGHALKTTTTGLDQVANGDTNLNEHLTGLTTGLRQAQQGLAALTTGEQQSTQALQMIPTTDETVQRRMESLAGNTQNNLAQTTRSLNNATQTLQLLQTQLQSGRPNLAAVQLTTQHLQQSLAQLQTQHVAAQTLATANQQAFSKLVTTDNTVANGVMQANHQGASILGQLNQGMTNLSTATGQLASGSQRLATSTDTIKTADQKITAGLTTGGQQLATTGTTTAKQIQHLVTPVLLTHTDTTHVQNNGTGMTPYLMSVALFVGCITFNIIYDMATPHKRPRGAWHWWAQKIPFLLEFTWLASTIMYVLLIAIDHLAPLQPWQTYGMVVLTMWTFGSIVTYFNLILGKTGAWLMLIFMIVQLGGSAGTYPIELSNHLFQVIHPYLPMSISIDAFRSTLSIGNSIRPEILIFSSIILIFNGLIWINFKLKLKTVQDHA
ncbi:YhgE/Pip family protein [Lactiplantibacillus fabifermentans]|uniref:Integral membrane protein n=2 Tax=Lactiplantibacillus fabifermentans TaxID=483011 RepID=A0A0R2NSB3_9LACO|nr:YhgE/Pip domain-containing protein [Lactiplantibacillus fabifermentans]ETY74747.1 hypothetical protein LFAB_05640 [Lactiplantibacillus fabifermentans T30PCM01]KRO26909.1 hypothetical protein DY78_GL000475 [Lactiplantibacillus fabifermentans DSM 21115]